MIFCQDWNVHIIVFLPVFELQKWNSNMMIFCQDWNVHIIAFLPVFELQPLLCSAFPQCCVCSHYVACDFLTNMSISSSNLYQETWFISGSWKRRKVAVIGQNTIVIMQPWQSFCHYRPHDPPYQKYVSMPSRLWNEIFVQESTNWRDISVMDSRVTCWPWPHPLLRVKTSILGTARTALGLNTKPIVRCFELSSVLSPTLCKKSLGLQRTC